jgi:PD-(D/E)XK nuclease superfamily
LGCHRRLLRRSPPPRQIEQRMAYHGDTETPSKSLYQELTESVIGAAIEMHRALGPGLLESAYLESAYEECLCRELYPRKLAFERQVPLPVQYKGVNVDCGYRLDLVVENV